MENYGQTIAVLSPEERHCEFGIKELLLYIERSLCSFNICLYPVACLIIRFQIEVPTIAI